MFEEDSLLDVLWDQVHTLYILWQHPVVQWQIAAFIGFLVAAGGAASLLNRLTQRWQAHIRRPKRAVWQYLLWRGLRSVGHLYFPVLSLLLGGGIIWLFDANGWRNGLIERLLPVFWILLAYRIVVALLYAVFQEKRAATYRRHVVVPLFIIFLILSLNDNFSGAFSLDDLPLFAVQGIQVTFGALFRAVVIFYLFFITAWLIKEILNNLVLPRFKADVGITNTVAVTSYYVIIFVGVLSATAIIGFDWRTLAIIGGGLSVGIGLGLQDLVNNFISGILLLFERTLRPGDVVEIDGHRGVVQNLRMRSTVLRTIDNVEIVVPNQNFLTSSLASYTQSDRIIRSIIDVGVSYGSDPTQVRDILMGIANRHGLVLDDPEPMVLFANFGDSSLNFQLVVFVEIADFFKVPSDLRFMIWNEFRRHKIEIPFPQRDLHVRSGIPWNALTERAAGAPNNGAGRPQELALEGPQGGKPADSETNEETEKPKAAGEPS